jgi:hypothetical protein
LAISHRERVPDWNAHQRAGWVTLWLWQGSRLSDSDIARLCGMSRQGALKMMVILEAALPIVKVSGKWQWIELREK